MRCIVDAYSWIDYFDANDAGEKVKQYIENQDNEIITNVLNIAEIASFFGRKGVDGEDAFKVIHSNSKIYNFNTEFSKKAGLLHAKMRKKIKDFGLIDAFVLLTARELKAKIITGDEHFRNLKEAVLIK